MKPNQLAEELREAAKHNQPDTYINTLLRKAAAALAQSAPAEVEAERPISIPTALILWAGVDDESQSTQWHQGYEAARSYVKMQIDSATPAVKQSLTCAEVAQGEPVAYVDADWLFQLRNIGSTVRRAHGTAGDSLIPLYTAPPSPDAELFELIGQLVSLAAIADQDTAAGIAARIDAKLAEVGE